MSGGDDDDDDDDDRSHLIWRGSDIAISHGHPGQNKLCIKTVVAPDITLQFSFIRTALLCFSTMGVVTRSPIELSGDS